MSSTAALNEHSFFHCEYLIMQLTNIAAKQHDRMKLEKDILEYDILTFPNFV